MNIAKIGSKDLPQFFTYISNKFDQFKEEFGRYGITTEESLDLKIGTGILCYYDLQSCDINLSVPDLNDPIGKVQFIFMRDLLGFEDNDEFVQFVYLIMPHLLAHEMGHYYRHRYGLFSSDLWQEEQIANQFANAVTKNRYTPPEMHLLVTYLKRAVENISQKMAVKNIAVGSYYSPLHALNAIGMITSEMMDSVQIVQQLFAINPEEILKSLDWQSRWETDILVRRGEFIGEFNEEYTSDIVKYMYYQLGWMILDLQSREHHYVDDLIKRHLKTTSDILPVPPQKKSAENDILACYLCFQETRVRSDIIGRYFYKRYRSLLFALIQQYGTEKPGKDSLLRREVKMIVESWDEKDFDVLDYVVHVAPEGIRRLFPGMIEQLQLGEDFSLENILCETDLRIWQTIMHQVSDLEAKKTIERLTMFDRIPGFRSLGPDILLELAHEFCKVTCAAGETIIWEGSNNADLFILTSGKLEVLVQTTYGEAVIATISPGEICGEMSFLTGRRRSATVRAVVASECFVLRSSDLRILIVKEPSILFQIAKILADRLQASDKSLKSTQ